VRKALLTIRCDISRQGGNPCRKPVLFVGQLVAWFPETALENAAEYWRGHWENQATRGRLHAAIAESDAGYHVDGPEDLPLNFDPDSHAAEALRLKHYFGSAHRLDSDLLLAVVPCASRLLPLNEKFVALDPRTLVELLGKSKSAGLSAVRHEEAMSHLVFEAAGFK